ncbi:MAG: hypothetical protein ABR955_08900 [Verrucomicrobiota bacterium]
MRRRPGNFKVRAARQFAQLQFHCGTPPPAAEPRTRIFTGVKNKTGKSADLPCQPTVPQPRLLAHVDVGGYFHGEADFFELRFNPCIHNYLFVATDAALFSVNMQENLWLAHGTRRKIKFSL